MLLFQRIEELAYKHTDARRTIGEFLLAEKSKIEKYSMQEIADKTFTSKSSMVRFAKALGFSGWKEFQKQFLSETYYEGTHYTDIDPNFPFAKEDSTKDIVYKLCNLQVESILDTTDQLSVRQLELAVDYMLHAERIALLGQPPNTYVGYLFRRKMLAIGKPVMISNGGEQGLSVHCLSSKDCAILISYSGNNEERVPMQYIPFLKEKKIPIIAITGLGSNLLRRQADCVLSMSSRERLYTKIGTFATEESIGYILNLLYSCYFSKKYDENLKHKIETSKHLEKRFSMYRDMREGEIEER